MREKGRKEKDERGAEKDKKGIKKDDRKEQG